MELSTVFSPTELEELHSFGAPNANNAFILSNTQPATMKELTEQHIIPVWLKDNEPLISQGDFISSIYEVVNQVYQRETINEPAIRVSHPIKGRIPSAKDKPAKELQEHEKTLYYERMMFAFEIPSIRQDINGNTLSLTVGGIKAYNLDNLYNKKGAFEHFKVFVGFKNLVCTNLCISTDGVADDLKVRSINELQELVYQLLINHSVTQQLSDLQSLMSHSLSEQQFAQFVGRARMYQQLNTHDRKGIPPMRYSDTQMIAVTRDYYHDQNFRRHLNGSISLWNLHNLLTGANKSSYIDSFIDRACNASNITDELAYSLERSIPNWFQS